jgi:hypothetical protein
MIDFAKTLPVVIVSTAALFGLESAVGSDTPSLPRYRLQKGQEIQFHGQTESQITKRDYISKFGDTTEWTLWVARQNDDGSWRLILRLNTKGWSQSDSDTKRTEQPIESKVCYFDLMPDGRIRANGSLIEAKAEPERLFALLPPDVPAAQSGWEGDGDERIGFAHWKLKLDKQQDSKGISPATNTGAAANRGPAPAA